MQEQMENVSKEIETLRIKKKAKKKKHNNTGTKTQNAFDGLINRLDMAEERISKIEGMVIKTSRKEKKTERKQNERV